MKNKLKNIKIKKTATLFLLLCGLVISGFIFQSQIKNLAANYFVFKGNYYFNNGAYDTEKSEKYFNRALRLNPNIDFAYYQLARIHLVENELNLGREEIDKAIAINPENKRAFYIRGLIDGYDGEYTDAIMDFQKFVEFAPTEWAGYNDLAWAYFLNKDYESVKEISRLGLDKTGEDNPWLLNGLGLAYVNLGEPEKAEEFFDKAKKLSSEMTPEKWASAYPGNDPGKTETNFEKFKADIDSNAKLAMEGKTSGGTFASACNSATCPCSATTLLGTICSSFTDWDLFNGLECYNCIGTQVAGNNPPTKPIVTGDTTGIPNVVYTFCARATDPDGDQVRYGFDFNMSGVIGPGSWTGYVNSGVAACFKKQWPSVGEQKFQVITQDFNGRNSQSGGVNAWTPYSITLSAAAVPAACGTRSKTYSLGATGWNFPGATFCAPGVPPTPFPTFPIGGGPVSWVCEGLNGGAPANCSACLPVLGPTICMHRDLGNVCSPENCDKTITSREAYCIKNDVSGCSSLPSQVVPCGNTPCTNDTVPCPSCSWKEVKP